MSGVYCLKFLKVAFLLLFFEKLPHSLFYVSILFLTFFSNTMFQMHLWPSLQLTERYIIKNICRSLCKVPVIVVRFLLNLNFLDKIFFFSKNTQILNSVKIRPVGAELFHAGGQTILRRRLKNSALYWIRRPPIYEYPSLHCLNPVRILSHCYLKTDCSIILLSIGVPSKAFHSLRSPTLTL